MNTAQYCTLLESLFGQHYEIEALISEFEVIPAVWKALIIQKHNIEYIENNNNIVNNINTE